MEENQYKVEKKRIEFNKVILPIAFWSIAFLVLVVQTGGIITFDQNTGYIGDTIGGTLGPLLNFAGLILVWLSLRDQLKTNKKQNKAFRRERRQQDVNNKHQEGERALAICLRLVEEVNKYWTSNSESIKRLLAEESKLIFSDPRDYEENEMMFWSETEFWAVSRDLIRARVFLNVLKETALNLGREQRVLVTTLFEENYYTHLRRIRLLNREANHDEWEVFHNRYPGAKVPTSRTVIEINTQLSAFDAFCESIGARGQWLKL